MLHSQRTRHHQHQSDLRFANGLLRAHTSLGWLPALLLLLHALYFHSAAVMTWYLASLILVPLIKSGREFARGWLACLFLAGAVGGLLLALYPPAAPDPADPPPPLDQGLLTSWVAVFSLFYLAQGLFLLASRRVKRAVARGFFRW